MLKICSSNPPVVTGICDPHKSRARHHCSLKLGSKLKYLNRKATEETNKFELSANNDKRIQSINSIETYAYGTSKDLSCKK